MDNRLNFLKAASKKIVHKAGEFLQNRITNAVTNSNEDKVVKEGPVKDMIIPPEERDEILNKLTN